MGSGQLSFGTGTQTAAIKVKIKGKGRYDTASRFRVVLTDPTGGAKFDKESDGGEDSCILTVIIRASDDHKATLDRISSQVNWNKISRGTQNWKGQFVEAVFLEDGADDEEFDGPSKLDKFIHFASMPW